jgi:serine/threonine-protein phosphatase 2A regulatory subunit A
MDPSTAYRLILDFRSPDYSARLKSIAALPEIIALLGPARTYTELLPYLFESPGLSESLLSSTLSRFSEAKFSSYGTMGFQALLKALDPVSHYESKRIRDAYVNCVIAISNQFQPRQVNASLPPIIQPMLAHEWTPHQSCGVLLLARLFKRFDSKCQRELLEGLIECAKSAQTGILQRAVLEAFTALLPTLPQGFDFEKWGNAVSSIAESPSPTTACDVPRFLEEFMKVSENWDLVEKIGQKLMGNSNWRVRLSFVRAIGVLFGRFSGGQEAEVFMHWLEAAAEDPEEEIRIADCAQIAAFELDLAAVIEILQNDKSEEVRKALIKGIIGYHDKEIVRTVLLGFLKDQAGIVLEALRALKEVNAGNDGFSEVILKFLEDTHDWRDRMAIIQALPDLGLNSVEVIERLLNDEAIAVRYAVVDLLSIIRLPAKEVVRLVREASRSEDYQMRQTAITAIAGLGLWTQKGIVPVVKALAKDPVAGVRLTLGRRVPKDLGEIVELLKRDTDPDVRDALPQ